MAQPELPGRRSPAVAANADGGFVVVWESRYQDGSGRGIVGRRLIGPLFADGFDADGTVCARSDQVGSVDICVP